MGWLLLAIVCAYGCAAAAPRLRSGLRGRPGAVAGWCCVPLVLACPALIPSGRVGLRAVSAVLSGDLFFRLVDWLRHGERGMPPGGYYRFLIPFPIFSAVYPGRPRRPPRLERPWPQVVRLAGGTLGATLGVVLVRALSRLALVRSSFAFNHAVMLFAFVIAIESLSRALCGLEHLAGFDTRPIVHNAYLSRTVSEFWRRYNDRIHGWLLRNVFEPAGGRRTPVRSVFLVFLVSGLFHEAMFALATSRLTGYQLAFFTLQAPAALASGRLERLARRGGLAGKVIAHAATLLFMAVTSVLFFEGVSKVFPFIYACPSPLP